MTRERFETLAEAYGGDVARWPAGERDAAALLMTEAPDWAKGVLARAAALDSALDALPAPRVSAEIMGRVLSAAPTARSSRRRSAWLSMLGLGGGLAGACAAGLILGARLAAPPPAAAPDSLMAAAGAEDISLYFDGEG